MIIINAPFYHLTLPSYDVASLTATLETYNEKVKIFDIYLEYAEYIGGDVYVSLMNSISGDALFSALLFEKEEIFFDNSNISYKDASILLKNTKRFINNFTNNNLQELAHGQWILFHVYTKQLIPALYFAKQIRSSCDCKIVFSGYHCIGECGNSLCNTFSFVDKVFGHDIEFGISKYFKFIPAETSPKTFYEELPTPNYDQFMAHVSMLNTVFKEKYLHRHWLQVEFSRGCWWNKCNFCTLNYQNSCFIERTPERLVQDYSYLQSKYQTTQILVYERNSGLHWREQIAALQQRFPEMRGTYDLSFKVSELQDIGKLLFLKENNIRFLVGIETFSSRINSKINKGNSVLESIQLLKRVEKLGLSCVYNLIYGFPFETFADYQESKETIEKIIHLLPPFDFEKFRLTFGSTIFKDYKKYNIRRVLPRQEYEKKLIPTSIQMSLTPFFYDFECEDNTELVDESLWIQLWDYWKSRYFSYLVSDNSKIHSLLYIRKNQWATEIYDGRKSGDYSIYKISKLEEEILLFCDSIRNLDEIQRKFMKVKRDDLSNNINKLVDKNLLIFEKQNYLSVVM